MELSNELIRDVRWNLRKAALEMSMMKLNGSSKWAAEALNGICEEVTVDQLGLESPMDKLGKHIEIKEPGNSKISGDIPNKNFLSFHDNKSNFYFNEKWQKA